MQFVLAASLLRIFYYNQLSFTTNKLNTTIFFRYEAFFNRTDIDHWEARKAMNDLCGMDLVPDPKIIIAAMKACRRLNDYALAVR